MPEIEYDYASGAPRLRTSTVAPSVAPGAVSAGLPPMDTFLQFAAQQAAAKEAARKKAQDEAMAVARRAEGDADEDAAFRRNMAQRGMLMQEQQAANADEEANRLDPIFTKSVGGFNQIGGMMQARPGEVGAVAAGYAPKGQRGLQTPSSAILRDSPPISSAADDLDFDELKRNEIGLAAERLRKSREASDPSVAQRALTSFGRY